MKHQYFIRTEDKAGAVKLIGRACDGKPWSEVDKVRRALISFERKHGANLLISIAVLILDAGGRVVDTSQIWLD